MVHFEHDGHALVIDTEHPGRLGSIVRPKECLLLHAPVRKQSEWVEAFCAAHPNLVLPVPWQKDVRGVTRVLQTYRDGAHTRWRPVAERMIAVRDKGCLVSYAWRADLAAHPGVLVRADIYMHGRMRVEWAWNPLNNEHTLLDGKGMRLDAAAPRVALREFLRLAMQYASRYRANAETARTLLEELEA